MERDKLRHPSHMRTLDLLYATKFVTSNAPSEAVLVAGSPCLRWARRSDLTYDRLSHFSERLGDRRSKRLNPGFRSDCEGVESNSNAMRHA